MNRIDLAPENQFSEAMKKALADIQEIKQRQFIGSDSLKPKVISTDKAFDFEAVYNTVGNPPPFDYWYLSLGMEFIADHQLNPYATLLFEMYDAGNNLIDPGHIISLDSSSNFQSDIHNGNVLLELFLVVDRYFKIKTLAYTSDTGTLLLTDLFDGVAL